VCACSLIWQSVYRPADLPFLWFPYKDAAGGLSSLFPKLQARHLMKSRPYGRARLRP
jgi:hypothetical protein